jgi:signal transduction histidine kinase
VKDEGIGLSGDQLERIFDRFYQVDGSATRHFGGAGLGLALVKEVVEAHGGAVWAESEGVAGKGCTFTLCLPAHESDSVA